MPDLDLAPAWELELSDGTYLAGGLKTLVRRVMVHASVDGADELQLVASAWDDQEQAWRFVGQTVLGAGNKVILWGGYGKDLAPLQRFRLVREEVQYPDGDDVPTVTIRGYSAEAELVEGTVERSWEGPIADSAIAEEIADEYGFYHDSDTIQATDPREDGRVKAKGTTDLEFLQQLAVASGYGPPIVRWDNDRRRNVLYFRATDLSHQAEQATFVYNPHVAGSTSPTGTCRSFKAELSLSDAPTKIEVIGWDKVQQEAIKVVLEITDTGQETTIYEGGSVKDLPKAIRSGAELQVRVLDGSDDAKGERKEALSIPALGTRDDVLAWAERWFATRQQAFLVGRSKTVGYENGWVGQVHRWTGLASTHEGLWEALEVKHTWDADGYTCDWELSRVLVDNATPVESA